MTTDFIPAQHPRNLDGKFAAKAGAEAEGGADALSVDPYADGCFELTTGVEGMEDRVLLERLSGDIEFTSFRADGSERASVILSPYDLERLSEAMSRAESIAISNPMRPADKPLAVLEPCGTDMRLFFREPGGRREGGIILTDSDCAEISKAIDHLAGDGDPASCCADPECSGNPCTFPGYADNH